MKKKNTNNKYDFLIIVLIALLCFGNIGGALQIVRLFALLFAPMMIKKMNKCSFHLKPISNFVFFFYIYCCLSLLWTPDITQGAKELFYYFVHILLFFEIVVFSKYAQQPLNSISSGWIISVLLCSLIAVWEIRTGNHLSYSVHQDDLQNFGGIIIERKYASATFGNYNGYVTFLCFSMPWLYYAIMCKMQSRYKKYIAIVALLLAIVAIIYDASRGGFLTAGIMFLLFLLLSEKSPFRLFFYGLICTIVAFVVMNYLTDMTYVLRVRSEYGLTNDTSRFFLWTNALKGLISSGGLGVGIGGMVDTMKQYVNGGINVTHCLLIEFTLQYGIFFSFFLLKYLFSQFFKGMRLLDRERKVVVLMAFSTFPIYTIIDSAYLLNPSLYVLVATLFVFVNYDDNKFANTLLRKTT